MSSLLLAPLDFSISPFSSLSTVQLALAKLHTDFEESDALKICQLFFHKREKARQVQAGRGGNGSGSDGDQDDEDARFALVGLDFPLDGQLDELTVEQLAALVVLAHPDATELHILKAERIWRKRREKQFQAKKAQPIQKERQPDDRPPQAIAEPVVAKTRISLPLRPQNISPPAALPPVSKLQSPRERSPVSASLPVTSKSTAIVQANQAPAQPVTNGPRLDRPPRPVLPLPPVESPLPESLCREIFALKLSNLPIHDIQTRDDVSSLFLRPHLPDAVILHKPRDPDDVSRTAYVGWLFDFEKRTEAMQEVIRVRMGRWRAMAEFVDSDKPGWEWGDLTKVKRQHAWTVWNENERETVRLRLQAEAEGKRQIEEKRKAEEAAKSRNEVTQPAIRAQPERSKPSPVLVAPQIPKPQGKKVPIVNSEPEAIVLDSPVLPPIPSRPLHGIVFRPKPSHPSLPTRSIVADSGPSTRPLTSVQEQLSSLNRDPRTMGVLPSRSFPSEPHLGSSDSLSSIPSVSERDLPPHIAAQQVSMQPEAVSSPLGEVFPPRPAPQFTVRQQPPQQVDQVKAIPRRVRTPSSSSTLSTSNRPQESQVSSDPPTPSLLARTTDIEVRGTAPVLPPSVDRAQVKKPSLLDRLEGNIGSAGDTSFRKSPSVDSSRTGSQQSQPSIVPSNRSSLPSPSSTMTSQQKPSLNARRVSGDGRGNSTPNPNDNGGNTGGKGKAKGNKNGNANQSGSQITNSKPNSRNTSPQSQQGAKQNQQQSKQGQQQPMRQQQQQGQQQRQQQRQQQGNQQGQQPRGKKRAATDDSDSQQDQPSNLQRNVSGGGSSNTGSILDRVEGGNRNGSKGSGGGGPGGPAKKLKNNSTSNGEGTRGPQQGSGQSLLSRMILPSRP